MLESVLPSLQLSINPKYIGYFRFLLEGYDGMVVLTTLDAKSGQVILRYSSEFNDELDLLLLELRDKLNINII